MKTATINNFNYQSVFGDMRFDSISVLIPDDFSPRKIRISEDLDGIDYSVPVAELKRMERELALAFFSSSYRAIMKGERTISVNELKGIQDILDVNRSEFGKLLGLHKGSVTNLFKGKAMKSTLCLLIMERLGMELGRPGSARHMLDGGNPTGHVPDARRVINQTRYGRDDRAA
jgi:hypothetical protein